MFDDHRFLGPFEGRVLGRPTLEPNEPIGAGISTPPTLLATAQALGMTVDKI